MPLRVADIIREFHRHEGHLLIQFLSRKFDLNRNCLPDNFSTLRSCLCCLKKKDLGTIILTLKLLSLDKSLPIQKKSPWQSQFILLNLLVCFVGERRQFHSRSASIASLGSYQTHTRQYGYQPSVPTLKGHFPSLNSLRHRKVRHQNKGNSRTFQYSGGVFMIRTCADDIFALDPAHPFEARKDYKTLFLTMWANYEYIVTIVMIVTS